MKNATRLEEEETVKVVRNGVGGTKRVWNPVTKQGGAKGVTLLSEAELGSRFLGWERRRGDKLHGRLFGGSRTVIANWEVAEIEGKRKSSRASARP
jgi:hypothetical protein